MTDDLSKHRKRGGDMTKYRRFGHQPEPLPLKSASQCCLLCDDDYPTPEMRRVGDPLRPGYLCPTCWRRADDDD